jgi:hypothetical protein
LQLPRPWTHWCPDKCLRKRVQIGIVKPPLAFIVADFQGRFQTTPRRRTSRANNPFGNLSKHLGKAAAVGRNGVNLSALNAENAKAQIRPHKTTKKLAATFAPETTHLRSCLSRFSCPNGTSCQHEAPWPARNTRETRQNTATQRPHANNRIRPRVENSRQNTGANRRACRQMQTSRQHIGKMRATGSRTASGCTQNSTQKNLTG